MADRLTGRDRGALWAVTGLAAVVVITAGWWALALWPVPGETPAWLARTRAACFGASESGLPDASGWIMLIGQPIGMLGVLVVGWPRATRQGLSLLAGSGMGRLALGVTALLIPLGLGAAGFRVSTAWGVGATTGPSGAELPPAEYPRLDRAAPGLTLTDQSGEPFALERYRGRAVLVTFAFAHCETMCPVLVRDVLAAQHRARAEAVGDPAVAVVTVDPWRDTPRRLPALAEQWALAADGHVLSGPVEEVLTALEAWNVPIRRDERTGDITHPALIYVIDRDGRMAYAATGGADYLLELLRRVE